MTAQIPDKITSENGVLITYSSAVSKVRQISPSPAKILQVSLVNHSAVM